MVKRAPIETYCEKKISTLQKNAIGMIDYIDISSVDNIKKKIISFQTMNAKDAPSRAKQLLKKYDILVSTVRPNLNAVAVVESETDNLMVGSTGYCVLRCKDNMDFRYLFNFCQSQYFIDDMSSQATGASYPAVSTAIVRSSLIPNYPVDEQRRIASELDKITDLIDKRKEQLEKLDALVKARFVELFGATSADKCSKRIKDYAEVLGGYAFKSELFCSNAVPVIRISNINNGCVELDYNICFDELFWAQNKKFRAEQNDILMAMSGATTGKAGIYREDMPALINQRVACIRAKEGIAYPTFLFVATQLEWMYDLIQKTSAGCAQPNISGKQIENMPVPDATYEQQQQFAAFVEQTDKSKLEVKKSLEKLEVLKKALMQKYFG